MLFLPNSLCTSSSRSRGTVSTVDWVNLSPVLLKKTSANATGTYTIIHLWSGCIKLCTYMLIIFINQRVNFYSCKKSSSYSDAVSTKQVDFMRRWLYGKVHILTRKWHRFEVPLIISSLLVISMVIYYSIWLNYRCYSLLHYSSSPSKLYKMYDFIFDVHGMLPTLQQWERQISYGICLAVMSLTVPNCDQFLVNV